MPVSLANVKAMLRACSPFEEVACQIDAANSSSCGLKFYSFGSCAVEEFYQPAAGTSNRQPDTVSPA